MSDNRKMDLKLLETELKLRGYTPATLRAYLAHNANFLFFIKKQPDQIEERDIKSYLAYLIADRQSKPASVNLVLSALRFYYETVLKKKIFTDIKPPKLEKKLPTILTKDEMKILLEAAKNKKHRLLIEFLYASGMRVSECVNLKINDLDVKEKMGRVIAGKGKKDRHIILSETLIKNLQEYVDKRKKESEYIFPGHKGHLSVRMAQRIVTNAAKKANIKKRVFAHALRSSFATHLLEAGTDIRVIQTLLGHTSISTTERYLKVSTEQLKKVKSPLDTIQTDEG